jgi:hypothetical protein
MRNLTLSLFLFIFASSACAMDQSLASYYALALMTSLKAEKACTGMQRDDIRFSYLLSKVGQGPEDEAAMKAEMKQAAINVQNGLTKVGQAEWCSNIWRLFGPDGPGLIKRKQGQ